MSNVRIVTPIHTCGGMPGCTACFADLHAKIAAAETRERAWSLALQSLTPGGSEYADDPERCLTFVRGAREWQHKKILSLTKDLKHLRDQAGPDSCADQVVRRIEAERERDLAIAHDRQPYPTAWAYGQVCAVLNTTKEQLAAAEKRAEEAERFIGRHAPQCRHYSWPHGPRCFDALEQQLAEAQRKGHQLVNYLGPLMLAARAVVSGRAGSMDELRRMLDVKYDPTNGEALSLARQLAAANATIELLRAGISVAIEARSAESGERSTCLCVPGSFDCSYHHLLFALEAAEAKERS